MFGSDTALLNKSVFDAREFLEPILRRVSVEGQPMNLEDHTSGSPPSDEFQEMLSSKAVERDASGEDVI